MNDALSGPTREGSPQFGWRWLPWLIVAVAVAALLWCFATRQVPTPEQQIVQPTLIPSPCDADHIITIQKDCKPYPFELDPVLRGHTIMFKNTMGSPITIEFATGLATDSIIKIPAGDTGCATVDLQCAIGSYTYLVVGQGCGAPPIEARPRIIVHSSPDD